MSKQKQNPFAVQTPEDIPANDVKIGRASCRERV